MLEGMGAMDYWFCILAVVVDKTSNEFVCAEGMYTETILIHTLVYMGGYFR